MDKDSEKNMDKFVIRSSECSDFILKSLNETDFEAEEILFALCIGAAALIDGLRMTPEACCQIIREIYEKNKKTKE